MDSLDDKLVSAYNHYLAAEDKAGSNDIRMAYTLYLDSMKDCDKTNDYFKKIYSDYYDFFGRDDWEDTLKANYKANKDTIDQEWQFGLERWGKGVYFDAGMLYGRTWYALTGLPWIQPAAFTQ